MFRNFVDPPSLDRSSLGDSQKRNSSHVNNLDQSQNTNGCSDSTNDSQVYYHHNGDFSSQTNGTQNGGYTTSIYVGSKSDSSRLPQSYSNSQQQHQQYNQQQPAQQYYNHANQYQQIPHYEQNGDHQPQPYLNGHISDHRDSRDLDTHLVQQGLAGISLHDINRNENAYVPSKYSANGQPNSTSSIGVISHHHNFPNASYPPTASGVPTQSQIAHPPSMRDHHHALGSITENGVYENTTEDVYVNHQNQQQMHSQHHHQNHQMYAQTEHLQYPSGQFIPPTRPQQNWGSGWTPPVAAQQAKGPPAFSPNVPNTQRIYNVIPPPPPLSEPVFVGRRDVKMPSAVQESQIVSEKGTVRGFKNRVRAGIATFWAQPQDPRNFRQLEQGKIVIYATSMSVVRETSERCKSVRHLLQNHMVRYEERDLYMSREIQQELSFRLQQEGVTELRLPHVFADGIHMGGAEELLKLNEAGELRALLNNYQKITVRMMCDRCGGYRFVPCDVCHGSKRSLLRNHFTEEFCALRCMHCNESGLKRCDLCKDQQE